jgi:hypothetical protein
MTQVIRGLTISLLALSTLLPMPAAHAQEATTQSANQIAQLLQARNWWEDAGSFGGQAWGFIYIFGPHVREGWHRGTRVTHQGSHGSRPLGMAWFPLMHNNLPVVFIDQGFRQELFVIVHLDVPSERLVLYSAHRRQYVVWSSTRSPFTPETVRRSYPR